MSVACWASLLPLCSQIHFLSSLALIYSTRNCVSGCLADSFNATKFSPWNIPEVFERWVGVAWASVYSHISSISGISSVAPASLDSPLPWGASFCHVPMTCSPPSVPPGIKDIMASSVCYCCPLCTPFVHWLLNITITWVINSLYWISLGWNT